MSPPAFARTLRRLVGPTWYDGDPRLGSSKRLELGRSTVIEEPPYIVPSTHAAPREGHRPLLLKASVDAYRLRLVREVFADLPLHVVHITRNPFSAINGLIDGWSSDYFHSHLLQHSDRDEWWKFDLPPGALLADSIAERSRRQWVGAHEHILDTIHVADHTALVRAEQLMFGDRLDALSRLLSTLRLPVGDLDSARSVRPIMATATPRAQRWRSRSHLLHELVDQERVRPVMHELGYRADRDEHLW